MWLTTGMVLNCLSNDAVRRRASAKVAPSAHHYRPTTIDQLRPRPVLLLVSSAIRGGHPSWVKGGCSRQADGTAGLPPASEIPDSFRHLRFVPKPEVTSSARKLESKARMSGD